MDVEALKTSAKLFEGEHDFLSFAATDPDLTTRSLQISNEADQCERHPGDDSPANDGNRSSFVSGHDFSRDDKANQKSGALAPEDWPLISLTAIRTIFSSTWEQRQTESGPLLIYRVRGSGFLHHMVRNLVGTMLDVGRGRIRPDAIPSILAARSRAAAGPTAPARGLFLHSVEYKEQP
jgi:tRNA pseudouridine38-40 synthase